MLCPRRRQSTEAATWVRPLLAYWISPATRESTPMAKSISVRMSSKASPGRHLNSCWCKYFFSTGANTFSPKEVDHEDKLRSVFPEKKRHEACVHVGADLFVHNG